MKEFSADSGAAIADATVKETLTVAADQFAHLAVNALVSSLTNPRQRFDPVKLTELAESIQASGVHQPILVRPLPGSRVQETSREAHRGQKYQAYVVPTHEIVSGERRYRASVQAGVATIPALIRSLSDDQVLEIQLVENLQRDDLTELEEAEGYERLMQHNKINADQVAHKICKSRSYVYARLKLLDLCEAARKALREGQIDASRALAIARVPDTQLQLQALKQATSKDYHGEVPSYREFLRWLQQNLMLQLDAARFKITDALLVPAAGSCKECPKRTGAAPDLFTEIKSADVCTDPKCYHAKEAAHTAAQLQQAHERGQTIITGREAKALMPNSYSGIEGFLRLDDSRDSPTDKPLRKLLGKALEEAGVQPTLIDNPHKPGDLIAALPAATVATLLKARGHADAAATVDSDSKRSERDDAAAAKQKLVQKFEQGWRTALLETTWAAIKARPQLVRESDPSDEVLRLIALHYAGIANAESLRQLCDLLGLGKVAPGEALNEHIKACTAPEQVLQLLVMHKDVVFQSWRQDYGQAQNAGLLLIASDYGVDVDQVKAEVKAAMKAKAAAAKPKAQNQKTAPVPAAQATGVRGEAKAQKPALRKPKLSAKDAQLGIAAAMQGIEAGPVPGPETEQADQAVPVFKAGQQVVGGFALGQKVRVTSDTDKLGMIALKHAGKQGAITGREPGGGYWNVTFKGRNGGVAMFAEDQIEVVAP